MRIHLLQWLISILLASSSFENCVQQKGGIDVEGECDENTLKALRIILADGSLRKERMLIISEQVCRQCLDEFLETRQSKNDADTVAVIMVSNNQDLGRQLTAIYRRLNIFFHVTSGEMYRSIMQIDAKFISSLFVGVKQKGPHEFHAIGTLWDNKPLYPPQKIVSFLLSKQ